MSNEDVKTEETSGKSKGPLGIILVLFLVLAAILGLGLYNNAQKAQNSEGNATETQTASHDDEADTSETETAQAAASSEDTSTESVQSTVEIDVEALSTPRILGDVNAPVKISEHSSFSCSHCGTFHKTNFKKIKQDYIDTGKAYLVFDDFPRNRPDLLIGAIARCVPEQGYFNFIQLVFETQQQWIKDKNFIDYIKQNAKLTGATSEEIEACHNSTELHEAMANRREDAHKDKGVNSTPTLVIGSANSVNIGGLESYDKIKEIIDAAYAEAQKAE